MNHIFSFVGVSRFSILTMVEFMNEIVKCIVKEWLDYCQWLPTCMKSREKVIKKSAT